MYTNVDSSETVHLLGTVSNLTCDVGFIPNYQGNRTCDRTGDSLFGHWSGEMQTCLGVFNDWVHGIVSTILYCHLNLYIQPFALTLLTLLMGQSHIVQIETSGWRELWLHTLVIMNICSLVEQTEHVNQIENGVKTVFTA